MVLLLLPLEMFKPKEWNSSMEILGSGQNKESYKTTLLNMLRGSEGEEGTDDPVEGGGSTRGYGITLIPEPLEEIADQLSDRELASRIINYNENLMRKVPGLDFDNMPDAMKIAASDLMYNTGSLFRNFKTNLIDKNYSQALRDTLDVVSANDEDAGDVPKVVKGLANRRMQTYNYAAEQLGFPQITGNLITPSQKEGKVTNVTYNFESGDPFSFDTDKGMHTKSISDDKPTGYDPMPNVMQPQVSDDFMDFGADLTPNVPEGTPSLMGEMPVFGAEALMYPNRDIKILGGL